jgi:hypothetical protein
MTTESRAKIGNSAWTCRRFIGGWVTVVPASPPATQTTRGGDLGPHGVKVARPR